MVLENYDGIVFFNIMFYPCINCILSYCLDLLISGKNEGFHIFLFHIIVHRLFIRFCKVLPIWIVPRG